MKQYIRLGLIVSLATASVFASALTLHFQTEGHFTESGTSWQADGTTVTLSDGTVTPSTLSSLVYSFTKGAGVAVVPGSYTLVDGTGTLALTTGTVNFTLGTGLGAPISGPAGKVFTGNQAGIINFSGGTGIFAGLTGKGVLSFNTSADAASPSRGLATTNFDATFEAVPEPASLVALGVGAFGLAARRRRK